MCRLSKRAPVTMDTHDGNPDGFFTKARKWKNKKYNITDKTKRPKDIKYPNLISSDSSEEETEDTNLVGPVVRKYKPIQIVIKTEDVAPTDMNNHNKIWESSASTIFKCTCLALSVYPQSKADHITIEQDLPNVRVPYHTYTQPDSKDKKNHH